MTSQRQQLGRRSAKVILLGEPGVGKTSIFRSLKDGTFCAESTVTAGTDQFDWEYREGETAVTLRIEDTAGMEKKVALSTAYFRESSAIVFVYAVNKSGTLEMLNDWVEMARNVAPPNVQFFLVGNKIDLTAMVEKEKIDEFVQYVNIDKEYIRENWVFQMSCKTGRGVRDAFATIATAINVEPRPPPPEPVIVLHEVQAGKQRHCCRSN
eukprot:m.7634 g.7634  ORF g.7634 m.7634 type:complete len:210 (+) comp19255_c0_seq2:185-814(+)